MFLVGFVAVGVVAVILCMFWFRAHAHLLKRLRLTFFLSHHHHNCFSTNHSAFAEKDLNSRWPIPVNDFKVHHLVGLVIESLNEKRAIPKYSVLRRPRFKS